MRKIRAALVDDHRLFREGLRALLGGHDDVEVVGEAGDAREAMDLLTRVETDVILLDLTMPDGDGLTLLRELRRRGVTAPVLVLTMHQHGDMAADAFAAAAAGYAVKRQSEHELIEALRLVARGGRYLTPSLPRTILEDATQPKTAHARRAKDGAQPSVLAALSSREREIFARLVRGQDNAAIGKQLSISAKTVETHRTRLMKKLDVHSLGELIRLAARYGLLAA